MGGGFDGAFHRPPRAYPQPVPADELVLQPPPQSFAGPPQSLLFALFPVVGGLGIFAFALVYHNPLFLLIAGAMVTVTILFGVLMYWSQRRQGKQSARRRRRRYREYLAGQERRLAEVAALQRAAGERLSPDLQDQWGRVLRREHLWERRPQDPDFLAVRLGRGPVAHASRPRLDLGHDPLADHEARLVDEAERLVGRWRVLDGQPLRVALDETGVLSVVGDGERARACVRAMLCHAAVACAPLDLRLAVAHRPEDAAHWDWLKWLPHARAAAPAPGDDVAPAQPALAAGTDELAALLDEHVAPRLEQRRTLAAASPGAAPPPIEAPHLVLVVDGYTPGEPRVRLPLLREALAHGAELRVSVICLVARPEDEPSDARVRVGLPARGFATLEATGPGGARTDRVEPDAATLGAAEALARALAPVRLQEHAAGGGARADAGLLALLGIPSLDDVDPATDWRHRPRSLALRTTIGVTDSGAPLELDLKQAAEGGMGPHGLIIGATGSGKSELLRTLVAGLALTHPPDELAFVFVDFKGGAALAELEALPHTAGMITNLQAEARLIDRMHDALYAEQERRQQLLRDAGNADDVVQYRARRVEDPSLPPLPDLLVIIDEFGELLASRPDFIDLFVAIGRVGRSLGIHLLFSSQRFDEGRLRGLESHLRYRICLRTYSPLESKAVLGTPDAYVLPPDPGLGYLKVDASVYERFRTALVSRPVAAPGAAAPLVVPFGRAAAPAPRPVAAAGDAGPSEMRALVERLRAAGRDVAHQVWLAPLESRMPLDAVAPVGAPEGGLSATIGTVDLPRAQRQEPLVLDFSGTQGHLAVVGAPRSGKSTVLRTLALALAREHTPEQVRLLAIDFGGGALRALEGLPHCAAVAGAADRELVRQVVRHVRAVVDEREAEFRRLGIDAMHEARTRRAPGRPRFPDLFLLIDGWAQLKRDFVDLDLEIEALASGGLAFGVHVVIAAARWAEMRPSLSDNLGGRLELRLNEPLESEIGRREAERLPADAPGRGLVAGGAEVQCALPRLDGVAGADGLGEALAAAARELRAAWPGPPAERVRVLPLRLTPAELAADPDRPGIPIGVEEMRLEPVHVDLAAADPHFLILGDGESGRTNLLRAFVRGLAEREAPERAQVVIVDPRRTLADLASLPHVSVYAPHPRPAAEAAARLAATVQERLPGDAAGPPRWDGPRLYLVVDDYDLLAGPEGNPLAPLGPALPYGRDAGLHVILARRVAGTTRAAFEPFFQKLAELRGAGIILSGEAAEGPLLDNHRATPQPPGRGLLVRRGSQPVLVQTVLAPRDTTIATDEHLAGRAP